VAIDNRVSHDRNVSLRITARKGTEAPHLSQTVQGIQGGATYAFRAWVKGDGQTTPSLAGCSANPVCRATGSGKR